VVNARDHIKADCMILATAIIEKSDILYTDDDHLIKLAAGYMRAEKMPEVQNQPDLLQ
jgi:hypothetical protein